MPNGQDPTNSLTSAEAAAQITRNNASWSGGLGQSTLVTYAFRDSIPNGYSQTDDHKEADTFQAVPLSTQGVIALALQLWSDVAGIGFSRVTDQNSTLSNNATMLFGSYNSSTDASAAFAQYPGDRSVGSNSGDVWLNRNQAGLLDATIGTRNFAVLIHEIGHAIGLQHPGNYNAAPDAVIAYNTDALYVEDTTQYTVMSYFNRDKVLEASTANYTVEAPLLHDIAAAQRLYGANFGTRLDNTIYGFHSNITGPTAGIYNFNVNTNPNIAIWDAGGIDTIDLSGFTQNSDLNLGPGRFSSVGGQVQNLAMAELALNSLNQLVGWIENGIGGTGQDTLTGNAVANRLEGGGGNDSLYGLGGNDTLIGGTGNDYLAGGDDFDRLEGGQGDDILLGENGGDDLYGQEGNDNLQGGAGTDNLYGGEGNDFLLGQADPDGLNGGDGNDTLWGGASFDVLRGDAGEDTLLGEDGNDSLYGGTDNDYLSGGGGNDAVFGDTGDDDLYGDGDNDTLYGGDGWDLMDGGAGRDRASYAFSGNGLIVNLGFDRGDGTFGKVTSGTDFGDRFASIEDLEGSNFNDRIRGDANGNVLFGLGGNDEMDGGDGADTIYGGDGDDTLQGNAGGDYIDGGNGTDTIAFATAVSLNLTTNVQSGEGVGDTYVSMERFLGSPDADSMVGNSAAQYFGGGAGDDALYGMGGEDTLAGGAGNDLLDGGAGADMVSYASATAAVTLDLNFDRGDGTFGKVTGGDSGDSFNSIEDAEGTDFNDVLRGRPNVSNKLVGGAGNDELDGRGGYDLLLGGSGDDRLILNGNEQLVDGGFGGFDTIEGAGTAIFDFGANSFSVNGLSIFQVVDIEGAQGRDGNDRLIGNFLNLTLRGGGGSDVIQGWGGDNVLEGGAGADELFFGAGYDYADYRSSNAAVLVDIRSFIKTGGDATGDSWLDLPEGLLASAHNDSLGGSEGDNRILARAGNDYVSGYGGADTVDGGEGNDSLEGGLGADIVQGGDGNDILSDNEEVLLRSGADDGADDTLQGGAGNDTLMAMGGHDELDGGTGVDSLTGGAGNDTYTVDEAADIVVELDGGGTDTIRSSVGYALPDFVENLTLIGSGDIVGIGNGLGNVIIGNAGRNALFGGAGADSLSGGLGDDDYILEDALDTVTEAANGGTDTVWIGFDGAFTVAPNIEIVRFYGAATQVTGGDGPEQLVANQAVASVLNGGGGDDVLWGGPAGNVMDGGDGDDIIRGQGGGGTFTGGDGNDQYVVSALDTTIVELDGPLSGIDTAWVTVDGYVVGANVEIIRLAGGASSVTGPDTAAQIVANPGLASLLQGGSADDVLWGSDMGDTLRGGQGDDILRGQLGDDQMEGGQGNDQYVLLNAGDVVTELDGGGYDTAWIGVAPDTDMVLAAHVERGNLANGANRLTGNALGNVLVGDAQASILDGAGGDDLIFGSAYADVITGGTGDDILYSYGGADRFIYAGTGWGTDLIGGFSQAAGAKLDFRGSGIGFAQLNLNAAGGNTQVNLGQDVILVFGAVLTEADFLFG